MRILITGSGAFREALIDRLKREKNEIYTIGTQAAGSKTYHYDFKYSDRKIKHIIAGIMPEVIVFLGAQDEEFAVDWSQEQAMDYLAGLSNVLISAQQLGIGRFVYISSTQIYGMGWCSRLSEQSEKKPQDTRSLVLSEGESLCLNYTAMSKMESVVLRMTEIYGLASPFDFSSRLFLEATIAENLENFHPPVDMIFNPLYLSDAVDAVFKALAPGKAGGVFNVCGGQVMLSEFYRVISTLVKEKSLDEEALEKLEGTELIVPKDSGEIEEISIADLLKPDESAGSHSSNIIVERTYDGTEFSEAYGYRSIIDVNVGLKRTYGNMKRRLEKVVKTKTGKKKKLAFLAPLFPYLETLFAFTVFALLHYYVPDNIPPLANFDFLTLMIVLIGITLGGIQPVLAVMLCGIFLFVLRMQDGRAFLDAILDMRIIIKILNLLIIATICGYARDYMRSVMYEKNLEVDDLNNELVTIYKINAANTEIKQKLDERLAGYDDSLAKMFLITDRLNALSPEKVFFEAVDTVSDLMQCYDVSIYAVTGTDFKMCRLLARTPSSDRTYKISVSLDELGELKDVVSRDEVFVNRGMQTDLPMLAAPVFFDHELVSVIMLWDLPFENLSLYHVNRFMTLSRLIASSLGRAYAYTKDIRELAYVPGTEILLFDAFMEKLRIYKEALVKEAMQFKTIVVSPAKSRRNISNAELSAKLRPLLRANDYIGENRDDQDSLYVLLSNTDKDNIGIVIDRLGGVGLTGREIIL
ncbi:MAG: NAD(P)-dependent oxidoreductase [Lachnospiraceae bacterium]|nr:NAD(P)-dependent oxidoreductase [Lachnospiraceae bacterium]